MCWWKANGKTECSAPNNSRHCLSSFPVHCFINAISMLAVSFPSNCTPHFLCYLFPKYIAQHNDRYIDITQTFQFIKAVVSFRHVQITATVRHFSFSQSLNSSIRKKPRFSNTRVRMSSKKSWSQSIRTTLFSLSNRHLVSYTTVKLNAARLNGCYSRRSLLETQISLTQ